MTPRPDFESQTSDGQKFEFDATSGKQSSSLDKAVQDRIQKFMPEVAKDRKVTVEKLKSEYAGAFNAVEFDVEARALQNIIEGAEGNERIDFFNLKSYKELNSFLTQKNLTTKDQVNTRLNDVDKKLLATYVTLAGSQLTVDILGISKINAGPQEVFSKLAEKLTALGYNKQFDSSANSYVEVDLNNANNLLYAISLFQAYNDGMKIDMVAGENFLKRLDEWPVAPDLATLNQLYVSTTDTQQPIKREEREEEGTLPNPEITVTATSTKVTITTVVPDIPKGYTTKHTVEKNVTHILDIDAPLVFTDTDVNPGESYSYRVKTTFYDAAGIKKGETYSTAESITIPQGDEVVESAKEIPAPTNFEATVEGTTVTLAWQEPTDTSDINGYNIYKDGKPVSFVPKGGTEYVDTVVAVGQHTYEIEAVSTDDIASKKTSRTVAVEASDTTDVTPENLDETKTAIGNRKTALDEAYNQAENEAASPNDALTTYKTLLDQYKTLLREMQEFNPKQTDDSKDFTVQELASVAATITTIEKDKLPALEKRQNEVINVEGSIQEMHEAYEKELVVKELKQYNEKYRQALRAAVTTDASPSKRDAAKQAAIDVAFTAIDGIVSNADTALEAIAIRDTAMGNLKNALPQIISTFDEKGGKINVADKVKLTNREEKAALIVLEDVGQDEEAIREKLSSGRVETLGLTQLPAFESSNDATQKALQERREARDAVIAQQEKILELNRDITAKREEIRTLKTEKATKEKLIQEKRVKPNEVTTYEKRILDISERLKDLEGPVDNVASVAYTENALSQAEATLTTELLPNEQNALHAYKDAVGDLIDDDGSNWSALESWKDENLSPIAVELTDNRSSVTEFTGELKTTKERIDSINQEISTKIDTATISTAELVGLQRTRDERITEKKKLEAELRNEEFEKSIIYKREYAVYNELLSGEIKTLEAEKSVLKEEVTAKEGRLQQLVDVRADAASTEAGAKKAGQGIDAAVAKKEEIESNITALLGELYGTATLTNNQVRFETENGTRLLTRSNENGQVRWNVEIQGSPQKFTTEAVAETNVANSLTAQIEVIDQNINAVKDVQELLFTWNTYVDAAMRVELITQQQKAAEEEIAMREQICTEQQSILTEINNEAVSTFTQQDGASFSAVDEAFDALGKELFTTDAKGRTIRTATYTEEKYSLYISYQTYLDTNRAAYDAATTLYNEAFEKQAKAQKIIDKLKNQLTEATIVLQTADQAKDESKASLVDKNNAYRVKYKSELDQKDPEERKDEVPTEPVEITSDPINDEPIVETVAGTSVEVTVNSATGELLVPIKEFNGTDYVDAFQSLQPNELGTREFYHDGNKYKLVKDGETYKLQLVEKGPPALTVDVKNSTLSDIVNSVNQIPEKLIPSPQLSLNTTKYDISIAGGNAIAGIIDLVNTSSAEVILEDNETINFVATPKQFNVAGTPTGTPVSFSITRRGATIIIE